MAILAIENPIFQPAERIIAGITSAFPAQVTTTFDHDYVTGTIVRILIPDGYGIIPLNGKVFSITVTGSTTFTIDANTSTMEPFSTPSSGPQDKQFPQVVPIGEENSQLTAAVRNVLPL